MNSPKKLKKTLRFLHSTSYSLPDESKKILINSLVYSHINYCAPVWAGIGKVETQRLQRISNYSAKIILGGKRSDKATPYLNKLGWLKIRNYLDYQTLILMHKIMKHESNFPETIVKINRHYHPMLTRHNSLNLPRTTTHKFGESRFGVRGPQLWNTLPSNIKKMTLPAFKKATHEFLM